MGEPLRGWRKYYLIRDLANGSKTQEELAGEYEVTQQAISAFGKKWARRIEAVRADLENEFAGLWIADKKARIAELEKDAEIAEGLIEHFEEKIDASKTTMTPSGPTPPAVTVPHVAPRAPYGAPEPDADNANAINQLIRTRERLMRSAAEEMGAIPSKMQVNVNPVTVDYTINGVNPDEI